MAFPISPGGINDLLSGIPEELNPPTVLNIIRRIIPDCVLIQKIMRGSKTVDPGKCFEELFPLHRKRAEDLPRQFRQHFQGCSPP